LTAAEQALSEPIHFVGIGGAGLSALALLCLARGKRVSGCDVADSTAVRKLCKRGAEIAIGSGEHLVARAGAVVQSSAIPPSHPDLAAAQQCGLTVYDRRAWLPYFTAGYDVIAVAGTHGKTTTTAALAWALRGLGADPSAVIGGDVRNLDGNVLVGSGPLLVIEADEYGHAFLGLYPELAVLTNVEHDHPDQYPSAADVHADFSRFLANVKPGGRVVACGDDAGVRAVLTRSANVAIGATYGLEPRSTFRIQNLRPTDGCGCRFELAGSNGSHTPVTSRLPGVHNAFNLAAAIAACEQLGHDPADAAAALASFEGVHGRFELLAEIGDVALVEDYAHHPTAVRRTIDAAKQCWPERRVRVLFQPHTYSRVATFLQAFQAALAEADDVLIAEIFRARAKEEATVSAEQLAAGVPNSAHGSLEEMQCALVDRCGHGEILILMGAGSITAIGDATAHRLREHFADGRLATRGSRQRG
jgi:UDP-N-acetylmuramate--alanine ligase